MMDNRPVDPDLPEYEPGEPRFEGFDEVFHEIHAAHGPAVLREALALVEIGREDLEDAAAALEAAGKPSIAKLVLEVAAKAPSGIDLDNPYAENTLNWQQWRWSWWRKRQEASGEIERRLRQRQAGQERKH
jgi:hypothetical protein